MHSQTARWSKKLTETAGYRKVSQPTTGDLKLKCWASLIRWGKREKRLDGIHHRLKKRWLVKDCSDLKIFEEKRTPDEQILAFMKVKTWPMFIILI